jgi:hypothetical protein
MYKFILLTFVINGNLFFSYFIGCYFYLLATYCVICYHFIFNWFIEINTTNKSQKCHEGFDCSPGQLAGKRFQRKV